MRVRIILGLIITLLVSSCAQQTSCPTYESDYVYVPRKAAKANKSKKTKKKVSRAEQN